MPGLFDPKDPNYEIPGAGTALAGAGLVGIPAHFGAKWLNRPLGRSVFRDILEGKAGPVVSDPEGLAKRLLDLAGRGKDIKNISIDTAMDPRGPHWIPGWANRGQERLQLPKRLATPMIVSHEVGHAAASNPFSKALRLARGNRITPLLPYAALLGGSIAQDQDATELNLAQKASLPLAGLQAALTQGEELRASLVGKKLLQRMGQKTPHFWRQLLKTQGTYALGNLGYLAPIIGGTVALSSVARRRREAAEKAGLKKTSSALANDVLRRMGV